MKYLLLLILTGCSISKDIDSMASKMSGLDSNLDSMSSSLKNTENAIHLQTLAAALADMFSAQNVKYISPQSSNPTPMLGGGLTFAGEATPDELVGQVFLWNLEIQNNQPATYTQDTEDASDKDKFVLLTAMQVVSGMLTQSKLLTVVSSEAESQYGSAIPMILLLRYNFLTSYLFQVGFFANPMTTLGAFESAISYLTEVEYVEQNAKNMSYTITGFFEQDLNQTVSLPSTPISGNYCVQLLSKFKSDLSTTDQSTDRGRKILNELTSCNNSN